MSCLQCRDATADRPDALVLIGGSQDPFDTPYGELRQCASCRAYFRYTRDHDNEIGYVASPPTLDRLTRDQARDMSHEARVVTQRLRDYFAQQDDSYSRHVVEKQDAALARLTEAIAELEDRVPG